MPVVVSGSVDQTFRQWDLASGKVMDERFGHVGPVNAVADSPDGRWIATGGADGTVRYWKAAGGPAVAVLDGHTAAVFRLTFSPDGRGLRRFPGHRPPRLGSRVWAGPGRGSPRVLFDHTNYVYPVTFSPDGRTIASGGGTGRFASGTRPPGRRGPFCAATSITSPTWPLRPTTAGWFPAAVTRPFASGRSRRGRAARSCGTGRRVMRTLLTTLRSRRTATRAACASGDKLLLLGAAGRREAGTWAVPTDSALGLSSARTGDAWPWWTAAPTSSSSAR